MDTPKEVGRNEPCPCGSGKKYKRCCGVSAAPKLGTPKQAWPPAEGLPSAPGAVPGAMPPGMPEMDPQMMAQLSQALTRLPKGQMQRLQALVQKAMHGHDVSSEAQELERSLPPDFQALMQSYKAQAPAEMPGNMSEEEARKIVEAAAAEGKISPEEAAAAVAGTAEGSKLSKFWRNLTKK